VDIAGGGSKPQPEEIGSAVCCGRRLYRQQTPRPLSMDAADAVTSSVTSKGQVTIPKP
jgi:hypothetical protein